jgi:hypothetical protein
MSSNKDVNRRYPELDKSDLARRFEVTRPTIYRWLDAGKFTKAQLDWIVAEQGKAKRVKRTGTAVVKRTGTLPTADDTGTPHPPIVTHVAGAFSPIVAGTLSPDVTDAGDTGSLSPDVTVSDVTPSPNETEDTPKKRPLYYPTVADAVVLLPIACINVGPRLVALCTGHPNFMGFALILLQLLFLYIMPRILPAVIGWGEDNKWLKPILGFVVAPAIAIFLIAVNLCFSTESLGMVWDSMAASNQSTIDLHDRLTSERDAAQNSWTISMQQLRPIPSV